MRLHKYFFLLCFQISGVFFVSGKNVTENPFSIEKITEKGINFVDIVNRIQENNIAVSEKCYNQLKVLVKNPETLLRMADAWSKFPYSGAFYVATRSDWANYDECINLDVKDDTTRVLGKFCTWGFVLPDLTSSNPMDNPWKLSSCIPDECSDQDLANATGLPLFNEWACSTKETDSELDTGAIITIALLATIAIFMITSTIYDVYLHYTGQKTRHIILTAFSVFSNGKRLIIVSKKSKEQILCFNGMKFISMGWIISGHGLISWYLTPLEAEDNRALYQERRISQYTTTAHISVDTFFYISGFLMSYLYFKQETSKKPLSTQIKGIPLLIIHRYLRITPANAMGFFFSTYLLRYINNGPFYSYGVHKGLMEPCQKYWWTFFTYIQNYYNYQYGDSLCIPTTWYLSADMQLFVIAPLVIMPLSLIYRRSFKQVMAALLGINMFFFALPIFTKLYWQDYDPDFHEYDFHGKLISYFIGVMFGIYMRHEKHKTVVIKRSTNVILWFFALATMHGIMWYRGEVQLHYGYVAKSLCYSFTRPLWCIALSWITYSCFHGYGGFVNWILSCGLMQIGGKLTYCIYIVHGLVISRYALGVKFRFTFDDWNAFYINCGHFIVSMVIATIWSLAFEYPMITIERVIFGGGKPKTPKPKTDTGHDNPQKVS